MRLLLITNRYPVDADDSASPFVPHYVKAVTAHGVEIDVLTPSYAPSNRSPSDGSRFSTNDPAPGVRVFRFATGATTPVGSWNLVDPRSWLRLAQFIRNGQKVGERLCSQNAYDHVLALWALPSGHFAQNLSRRFRIPYSVWCLGSDIYTWATRPIIRSRIASVLSGASHVFGDGEDLCGRINAWLGINATFLPSFRPLDGLDSLTPPHPTESPRYLYLGRLHHDKGIFELLTAFANVRMAFPHAVLRYVGDGPGRGRLAAMAADMHLRHEDVMTGGVFIDGPASGQGVIRALLDCDIVMIPTRSDSIPLVFTEAVQAMRPVIGTDVGDLGTLIKRFGVGRLCPSAQSRDLARAMILAAHDPIFELRGRTELLQLFNPQRAAGIFCDHAFPSAGHPTLSTPVEQVAIMNHI